jgi:hypothetical protein
VLAVFFIVSNDDDSSLLISDRPHRHRAKGLVSIAVYIVQDQVHVVLAPARRLQRRRRAIELAGVLDEGLSTTFC